MEENKCYGFFYLKDKIDSNEKENISTILRECTTNNLICKSCSQSE